MFYSRQPVKIKTLTLSFVSLSLLIIVLLCYSLIIEPGRISVNTVTVADDHLSGLLGEKKVVHISDLHITSFGYREKKLIKMINDIGADILFITGDLITDGIDEGACLKVLKRIKRPAYGIWAVLGNTDRFIKNEPNKNINGFINKLKRLGIRVLEDSHERFFVKDRGEYMYIAGLEYSYVSRSRLDWLLRDIPSDAPIILLSHYPDILDNGTDALTVNLGESDGKQVIGWKWQDNYYFEHGSPIVRFDRTGIHKLRVQSRENGVSIEQIVLVSDAKHRPPRAALLQQPVTSQLDIYGKINPDTKHMITIKSKDIANSDIFGDWEKVYDTAALFNPVMKDTASSSTKSKDPLVEPENYFEADFYAEGGVDYHVWLRMKAGDSETVGPGRSDSVHIQFSDSVNRKGESIYRIGESGVRSNLKKINLILAGHTHGGQVRIPFLGSLDITQSHNLKYDMGLFEDQGTVMYVNRGIGTSMFPVRFNCPPEITLLKFIRTDDSVMKELKKAA